ncbi:MAG UNVERIFIED_CONTAM: hypothetical protein LVT10_00740 [Anaerolineae bacterium]|jgi:hypothetical protein
MAWAVRCRFKIRRRFNDLGGCFNELGGRFNSLGCLHRFKYRVLPSSTCASSAFTVDSKLAVAGDGNI